MLPFAVSMLYSHFYSMIKFDNNERFFFFIYFFSYNRIKLSMEIFVVIFRLDTICDCLNWPLSRIFINRLHASEFWMVPHATVLFDLTIFTCLCVYFFWFSILLTFVRLGACSHNFTAARAIIWLAFHLPLRNKQVQ